MLQPNPTPQPTPEMEASMDQPVGQELEVLEGDNPNMVGALEAHLDQLPDQEKAFLAEHMTPEFVRAIGLINGPEVAEYLNQFVDPNKVLVPVPREVAEQQLAQQQAPAQQPAEQGLMTPQQQPQQATATPAPV